MVELKDGAWAGKPGWLIGGGPSLEGFDWSLLKDVPGHILVINRAYMDVPWAHAFLTEDERFIRRYGHREDWKTFEGQKILAMVEPHYKAKIEEVDPTVRFIPQLDKRHGWSKSLDKGLSTSSNSAIPALNLLDIMGCDPIYLLGIDCRTKDNKDNYHTGKKDGYPESWRTATVQLDSFASDFQYWAGLHLKHRTIINLTTSECPSALTYWTRWERDSFLRTGKTDHIWEKVHR